MVNRSFRGWIGIWGSAVFLWGSSAQAHESSVCREIAAHTKIAGPNCRYQPKTVERLVELLKKQVQKSLTPAESSELQRLSEQMERLLVDSSSRQVVAALKIGFVLLGTKDPRPGAVLVSRKVFDEIIGAWDVSKLSPSSAAARPAQIMSHVCSVVAAQRGDYTALSTGKNPECENRYGGFVAAYYGKKPETGWTCAQTIFNVSRHRSTFPGRSAEFEKGIIDWWKSHDPNATCDIPKAPARCGKLKILCGGGRYGYLRGISLTPQARFGSTIVGSGPGFGDDGAGRPQVSTSFGVRGFLANDAVGLNIGLGIAVPSGKAEGADSNSQRALGAGSATIDLLGGIAGFGYIMTLDVKDGDVGHGAAIFVDAAAIERVTSAGKDK